jgi:uncharacterized FlgJ-related protein
MFPVQSKMPSWKRTNSYLALWSSDSNKRSFIIIAAYHNTEWNRRNEKQMLVFVTSYNKNVSDVSLKDQWLQMCLLDKNMQVVQEAI